MKKVKIKLKKKPDYKFGGQFNFALDLVPDTASITFGDKPQAVKSTLQAVPRDEANIEAELGEIVAADFDKDGLIETMKIAGKKHSRGGTPLSVPPGAFVYSDTPRMSLGGESLEQFGKSKNTKKKYTPAELAVQYDINPFKAVLEDKTADPIHKRTAQLMINNFNQKLGKLALVQEAKKGFPTGIPEIAIPYLTSNQDMMNTPQSEFKMGGSYKPKMDMGGIPTSPFWMPPVDPYKGDKLTTPNPRTGQPSKDWNKSKYSKAQWDDIKRKVGYNGPDKNLDFQKYLLQNYPDIVNYYHSNDQYGIPTGSKKMLDGLLGVRWDAIADKIMTPAAQAPPTMDRTLDPVTVTYNRPQEEDVMPNTADYKTATNPAGKYFTQDKMNVLAALDNSSRIKKYGPWEAPIVANTPTPTFYDPSRELAANSEAMNTEMMFNSQYSGPQAASVRNSAVSAQAGANAANTLGRYNNQNVGVANQFAGVNAEILNTEAAGNNQRANNLYRGNVIADQQFDNSKAQARDVIRKNLLGALTNKQKLQWINTFYPQVNLDAGSGDISFTSGYSQITPTANTASSFVEIYKKLKKDNPNVPDDVLKEQAKQMQGTATNTISSNGESKSTYKGAVPDYLQLLQFQQ